MESEIEQSDEQLVALAVEQKEFFGALITRYEAPLARYVRRLGVRSEDDIPDILQEVFIKVYRNLNDFDTNLKFSSWIYRIAHNETITWFRKRNVRPEGNLIDDSETVLLLESDESWDPSSEIDSAISAKELNVALAQLDEKYRSAIVLRFFEHKEYDEISDILKIPIGSVGTLLHRAKKQLATAINTEKITI